VDQTWYFGGGGADTVLLPIVAVLMVLTIILMFRLPRSYVVVPFLLSTFLIPREQMVVVAGVHLFVLRIIVLFAWLRLFWTKLSSSEKLYGGRLDVFDKVFTVWAVYRAFAFLAVFHFQTGAIINQTGAVMDAFGIYFLLRYLIRNDEDILRVLKVFAFIAALVGCCMVYEKFHDQNLFGYLGGPFKPEIRDGAIRAQGAFGHAILAGTFGATLVPLMIWLWKSGKAKALALMGIVGATLMALTSASSTPLMAYGAGIIGILFWPMRRHMRQFRWALVIGLVALHLAMKAPVWFLIERVTLVGGSSGYHRAELVDQFIRNFGDWWLVGTNTTAGYGDHLWDLSNQFVAEGESGGLVTFVCFIAMISICFSRIGRARKLLRKNRQQLYIWLFGCALLGHLVGFFGISYFDHVQVAWFALLIMINTATGTVIAQKFETKTQADTSVDATISTVGTPPLGSSAGVFISAGTK